MEKGFYHADLGYWQTVSGNPKTEDYMAGTIEVPLKPSADHEWYNGQWVDIPPAELTPEEVRTLMPDKTPREFRDILIDMGIFSQMVAEKINEIPFDIERQKALNAWEVSTYISRIDPYVDMIGAMFDQTPEQIDDAWLMDV